MKLWKLPPILKVLVSFCPPQNLVYFSEQWQKALGLRAIVSWTSWNIRRYLANESWMRKSGRPKRKSSSGRWSIQKLQRVQNNAARIVLQAPRRSHAKPLMRQLHWLPVQHRIDYQVSVLTYKTLNTSVPQYLSQHINRRVHARTLRSSATPLLIQPFARTDFAKRSFRCAAPSVWNSLPASVAESDSLSVFKSS